MSMGLTSDEEDEESTPIINTITSPMEEGTPTAPLNISNNAANNLAGMKRREVGEVFMRGINDMAIKSEICDILTYHHRFIVRYRIARFVGPRYRTNI